MYLICECLGFSIFLRAFLISFKKRPAGGTFTVEIASNRAKTSLSYGGRDMSDWPDGSHYPEDYVRISCLRTWLTYSRELTRSPGSRTYLHASFPPIVSFLSTFSPWFRLIIPFSPQVHAQNRSRAAGTAFAISYQVHSIRRIFVTRFPTYSSVVRYQESNPEQPRCLHHSLQVSLRVHSHSPV